MTLSSSLKIFVSSPGDVAEERVLAARVIERLQHEWAPRVDLEGIFWEHEPLRGTEDFQSQMPSPAEVDVFICILWARLGTRLPPHIIRQDGSRYESGTQYELEKATEGWRLRGDRPEILVYRKTAEPTVSLADTAAAAQRLEQKIALDRFVKSWFENADGSLRAAFHPFGSSAELEEILEKHLRKLLHRFAPPAVAAERSAALRSWMGGSPYRGLEVFKEDHARVFFGRTREASEVLQALRVQASTGQAFVLVLGASGSGKSSLVRAGVVPLLTAPGVIPGVGLWRRAVFIPRHSSGDLADGLAASLLQQDALPELAGEGAPAEIARRLRDQPSAADLLVKGTLSQAASSPEARLVLVVDQMEEIFTLAEVTVEARRSFVAALSALAGSGKVWVIATLRGDFYARCEEVPGLLDLMAGQGRYHLRPPDATAIGQIIRRPAEVAGLAFAEDPVTGERLDEVLRDAATARPESLPLLEFLLDQLYQERTPEGVLTFAAYRGLGGLEGAIGNRAEAIFLRQTPIDQAALPSVLRLLVTVRPEADLAPVSRQTSYASLSTAAKRLVDAFVEARIFIADTADDGQPVIRLTHEALLTHWPRVRAWLENDRDFLKIRAWLDQDATRWDQEGQNEDILLIPPGKELDRAARLLARDRSALRPILVRFIETSQEAARKSRGRAWGRYAAVAVLVLAGLGLLVWGLQKRSESQRFLADADVKQARIEIQEGRSDRALAYLARALRRSPSNLQAQSLLTGQLLRQAWPIPLASIPGEKGLTLHPSQDARFFATLSPAGTVRVYETWPLRAVGKEIPLGSGGQVLAISRQGRLLYVTTPRSPGKVLARVLNARTGQPAGLFAPIEGPVWMAEFSPDERWVAIATDRHVYVQATTAGLPEIPPIQAVVEFIQFSPDNRRLLLQSRDSVAVLDLARQSLQKLSTDESVEAQWSPDGRALLLSFTRHVQIVNAEDGLSFGKSYGFSGIFPVPRFSPDGERLIVGTLNNSLEIRDLRNPSVPLATIAARATTAEWSSDGQLLLTTSRDTVQLWDTRTGAAVARPWHEIQPWLNFETARFVGGSRRVVTLSEEGVVQIWDANPARPQEKLPQLSSSLPRAVFNPAGHLALLRDNTVTLWDTATGRPAGKPVAGGAETWELVIPCEGEIFAAVLSGRNSVRFLDFRHGGALGPRIELGGSGGVFVCGGGVLAVTIGPRADRWEITSGRRLPETIRHEARIVKLELSSDGARLATVSEDRMVRVWEISTGEALGPPFLSEAGVSALALSPDGLRVSIGAPGGEVEIRDSRTGRRIEGPMRHPEPLTQVDFDREGRSLRALTETTLTVWNTSNGKQIGKQVPVDGYDGAYFSPDGRFVLLAEPPQKLVEIATGQVLDEFRFPQLHDVFFSSDRKVFWAASVDGLWHFPLPLLSMEETRDLARLAEALGGYEMTSDDRVMPISDPVARLTELRRSMSSSPKEGLVASMIRWFLTEPRQRTLSPLIDLPREEVVRDLLEEKTSAAWDEAAEAFPGHPLLLQVPRPPDPPALSLNPGGAR